MTKENNKYKTDEAFWALINKSIVYHAAALDILKGDASPHCSVMERGMKLYLDSDLLDREAWDIFYKLNPKIEKSGYVANTLTKTVIRLDRENEQDKLRLTNKLEEIDTTKLYNFHTDTPKGKFIALFEDGSGCDLFYETEKGLFTESIIEIEIKIQNVGKDYFTDAGYFNFVLLPDDFEVCK